MSPLEDLANEPWMRRALCAQTDPEAFFPEKGGSTREAKRVCLTCDVRADCLDYSVAHGERFGIWGGLSERERRRYADVIPIDTNQVVDIDYTTFEDFTQEIA